MSSLDNQQPDLTAITSCEFPGMGYGRVLQVRSMATDGPYLLPSVLFSGGKRVDLYCVPVSTEPDCDTSTRLSPDTRRWVRVYQRR